MESRDINILDYFYLIYRARKYIVWNFIIVCVLAAAVSLFLPKYYKTTAILLPPAEKESAFGFSQLMSALPVNIRLGSQGSPSDIFVGIMKSQTVAFSIIEKFDLINIYKVKDKDRATLALKNLAKINTTKEGLIQIIVEDQNPVRAAGIANTYWAMLDSINKVISQGASREKADFLEQQMAENEESLKKAEQEIKNFQLQNNAFSPIHQQEALLSLTSEIAIDILAKENQLREYQEKFSENHPIMRELRTSIKIREEQMEDLRLGTRGEGRESFFIPLMDAPDLTIQYAKFTRRVEILNQIGQILRRQYEETRMEKINPTSTVRVLDKAEPPLKKSRPKRTLIVLVAGTASLFFSIVSIVAIEFFNHLTELSPANREKMERLARFLRINE